MARFASRFILVAAMRTLPLDCRQFASKRPSGLAT